jgi:hypothetical protein
MLKTLLGGSAIGLVVALGAYFGLRGDEEIVATPTPEPTAVVTPSETPPPEASVTTEPSATPEPSPTLAEGRAPEPAPIESVDVGLQDGQHVVVIVAGLPNGCTEPHSQEVTREGNVYTVTILNSVPEDDDAICTEIFRTYEVRVSIGDVLEPGETYTVVVNDQETTFTAQ